MSEATFTPGPWIVCEWDDEGMRHVIQQEEGLRLSVAYTIGGLRDGVQDANARLIAASPTLLDALQVMVDAFQFTDESMSQYEAVQIARAALRKALGEPSHG